MSEQEGVVREWRGLCNLVGYKEEEKESLSFGGKKIKRMLDHILLHEAENSNRSHTGSYSDHAQTHKTVNLTIN